MQSPDLKLLLPALTLAAFSTPSAADVLVVDRVNGPGTDYTTISAAIDAAVDGDILLIRSGDYGEIMRIDGKSLVLQEEAGATVSTLHLEVRNLSANQSVVVRGIDLEASLLTSTLLVSDCLGTVWVEDAFMDGSDPSFPFNGGGAQILRSNTVVLSRCTLPPHMHWTRLPGIVVDNSSLTLHGSTINGGFGVDSVKNPSAGTPAVQLIASTLFASDSILIGGTGGDVTGPFTTCRDAAPGGPGLEATSNSTAQLFGTQLIGGPGGLNLPGCAAGLQGQPAQATSGSTIADDSRSLGWMVQAGPVRSGNTFTTDITGQPGAFAWAVYGSAPTAGTGSPVYAGLPHVSIVPLLLQPLGLIPASGTLQLATSSTGILSPGAEGSNLISQLVTFSPMEGDIRVGGGTALLVLDPAF